MLSSLNQMTSIDSLKNPALQPEAKNEDNKPYSFSSNDSTHYSNPKKQKYIFRKSRKRIETLFSQLCDQFKIRNNYAKSFNGFKTRVLSKITALTFIQFVNVFVFNRKMNRFKIELI